MTKRKELTAFWDARYSEDGFAYGDEPNTFFKQVIDRLPVGTVLIPAAGEGRDAVYAAQLGWKVYAFDLSEAGRDKALQLAQQKQVVIQYDLLNVKDLVAYYSLSVGGHQKKRGDAHSAAAPQSMYTNIQFDLIALTYFHLPKQLRRSLNAVLVGMLSKEGNIVLEAFNPHQLGKSSGGPPVLDLLMSKEELAEEFQRLEVMENDYHQVDLQEGRYHRGLAEVVRFWGRVR